MIRAAPEFNRKERLGGQGRSSAQGNSLMASVLLVEDVRFVRALLRRFLEAGGHEVMECDGGEKAGGLVARHRFDVVVTDICMQDGDGVAFIRGLRSNGATPAIIAMTGGDPSLARSESAGRAIDAGADLVLMKPVSKPELLAAVAGAFTTSGALSSRTC